MNSQDPLLSEAQQHRVERRAKWRWIGVVVGLLSLQVVIGIVALVLALNNTSTVVMPNYHQAALDWDQTRRERGAAQRLGWQVQLRPAEIVDGQGRRLLRLHIKDRNGKSLDDLHVTAEIYHHANAADVRSTTWDAIGDGTYQTLAPMAHSGVWQVNIDIPVSGETVALQNTVEL